MVRIFKSKNSRLFYIETVAEGHPEDFSYVREGDLFSIDRLNTKILEVNKASYTIFANDLGETFENADKFEQYLIKNLESDRVLVEEDLIVKYEPNVIVDETSIGDRGINETFDFTFTGKFLDFVNEVSINDNQEVEILKKDFNSLKVRVVTNSKIQENQISLIYPTGVKTFGFKTANIESVVPSLTGQGEALWQQPAIIPANNIVTLSDGRFEAEQANGGGWDNHAYYGGFQGNFSKITHEFTTVNDTNAYCFIRFTNNVQPSTTGNPRLYILNATSLRVYSNVGTQISNTSIKGGDRIRVEFTNTSIQVFVNGDSVILNNADYSIAMQGSYVNFTSFRFSIFDNIITRKFI